MLRELSHLVAFTRAAPCWQAPMFEGCLYWDGLEVGLLTRDAGGYCILQKARREDVESGE
jgi:hypothetical protein